MVISIIALLISILLPALGADPLGFSGFDVVSQARRYDPQNTYTDLWLGERTETIQHIVDPHRSLAEAETPWQSATR